MAASGEDISMAVDRGYGLRIVVGVWRAGSCGTRVRLLRQGGVETRLGEGAVDKHTATRKLIRV